MGQTQFYDEPVSRCQHSTVFEGQSQFAFCLISKVGIDLSHSGDTSVQTLPHFLVFKFFVCIISRELIDGHITVELLSHGKVLVCIIHCHIHGLVTALYCRNLKCRIRSSPIWCRLHFQYIGNGFFFSCCQDDLKLRTLF